MIKIDVEGAEMQVLIGGEITLRRHSPTIFLSTHSGELRDQCLGHLAELGYRHEPLVPGDDPHEFLLRKN